MFLEEATLPTGLRVYAVGDVHGCAGLLADMLEKIEDDAGGHPPDQWRIVMLGDYTDRGPHSRQVLDMLAARMDDPRFVFLRGNHDEWLERFLAEPEEVGDSFLYWGGMETLESYGIRTYGEAVTNSELSSELNRRFPAAHRRFLSRLQYSYSLGDYFFVHAGVRPGVALASQSPRDLMWIRDEFNHFEGSFGKIVVHGHTPHDDVEILANRINVDTRAFASGVLSAVAMEANRRRILQVRAG